MSASRFKSRLRKLEEAVSSTRSKNVMVVFNAEELELLKSVSAGVPLATFVRAMALEAAKVLRDGDGVSV